MLPTIDLQGDNFILHIGTANRTLTVPATADGMAYLKEIIKNSKAYFASKHRENRSGHIAGFPTQHVIEQWQRADAKKKAEQSKAEVEEKFGIELNKLQLKI